jgi:hypothetical protein
LLGTPIWDNQQPRIKIDIINKASYWELIMKSIINSKYPLKYIYKVTEDGKIFSERTNKFLSTRLDKDGYEKVSLVCCDNKRHSFSVHRLVMENFSPIEGMENLQVNHIDGNKINNNLSNLEWCTCRENIDHAIKNNLRAPQFGEHNPASKISEEQVKEIINLLLTKQYSGAEIDRMYGLCNDYANSIRRKERWKYLTKDINFD